MIPPEPSVNIGDTLLNNYHLLGHRLEPFNR